MDMIHGGDIYRNQVKLDFSVNVNPFGVPEAVRNALHNAVDWCSVYPDIREEKLRNSVSAMLQVPGDDLVFGNGASELFMAIIHALQPSQVVIPVPSFYGYEHAAKAVTEHIRYYQMREEDGFLPKEDLLGFLNEETDLLFLANPNNPTGALMKKDALLRLLTHCKRRRIAVVLDECFIEFCGEQESMLDMVSEFENLILVRAFTKIYAIPGVRLGYLVCGNPLLRERIRRQLPEWNLSVFAQAAGAACAKEREFLLKTADYVREERRFLAEGFQKLEKGKKISCQIYPGHANFMLLHSNNPLYDRLLCQGILIRNCENFKGLGKGYYRIAVKTREENEQLLKTMGEINWNE
ncbi:MAG: pyridoxal phosphate-dependent aminotransferase [Brotaphodocola sp.]